MSRFLTRNLKNETFLRVFPQVDTYLILKNLQKTYGYPTIHFVFQKDIVRGRNILMGKYTNFSVLKLQSISQNGLLILFARVL